MTSRSERRSGNSENIDMRDGLTLIQEYEVNQLERAGASLLFVRHATSAETLAILSTISDLIIVDFEGDLSGADGLKIRH